MIDTIQMRRGSRGREKDRGEKRSEENYDVSCPLTRYTQQICSLRITNMYFKKS